MMKASSVSERSEEKHGGPVTLVGTTLCPCCTDLLCIFDGGKSCSRVTTLPKGIARCAMFILYCRASNGCVFRCGSLFGASLLYTTD